MKKSEAPASVNTVKRMKMKKSEALAVDVDRRSRGGLGTVPPRVAKMMKKMMKSEALAVHVDRRLLGHEGILPGRGPGGGRTRARPESPRTHTTHTTSDVLDGSWLYPYPTDSRLCGVRGARAKATQPRVGPGMGAPRGAYR